MPNKSLKIREEQIDKLKESTDEVIEACSKNSSLEKKIDRKIFFDTYRKKFGKLTQGQVEGLNSLLSSFENDKELSNINEMAYMLATVKHETANKFKPISEYGDKPYFNRYDPVLANSDARKKRAKDMGNTEKGDGYKYRGRGYVQITWKNNYKKLGEILGYDLSEKPELALDPKIAYAIMSHGMRNGLFTGRKLSKYITKDSTDYKNARKVINGLDKADTIKGYAASFEKVLTDSKK